MTYFRLMLFSFYCFTFLIHAHEIEKKSYDLKRDPIDVVIVSHPKDKPTINLCIEGLKKNCVDVRRIIVVSSEPLTDQAEWFDEKLFPFSLKDVYLAIGRGDKTISKNYFRRHYRPPGWYFQMLLKLYAPFVIPDISSNVLVVDADTIFMNPVKFLNDSNGGLFNISRRRAKKRYLHQVERLIPGYERVHPEVYSVCHHMLFQRSILEDLFNTVENFHHLPFWKSFCLAVDTKKLKGASEYEAYFNFALTRSNQVELRELKWTDSGKLEKRDNFKNEGYHYVSFHTYMRK